MLSFLLKLFTLSISFKLLASLTEFCYKCDGRCTKPPTVEWCNASIDKNAVCMIKKDPVKKTEKRSCLYPSIDSEDIEDCDDEDDGICRICEENFCNIPIKRKIKGPSRCYYCRQECKNPLETTECYYLQNACITVMKFAEYEGETKVVDIYRECQELGANDKPNALCSFYESSPNYNCSACATSMCNRLPDDPPDPTPHPQLSANFAKVFVCNRILFEFSIYILTFIVK